jgi:hypothetical protein
MSNENIPVHPMKYVDETTDLPRNRFLKSNEQSVSTLQAKKATDIPLEEDLKEESKPPSSVHRHITRKKSGVT